MSNSRGKIKIDETFIKSTMNEKDVDISGITITSFDAHGPIDFIPIGIDRVAKTKLTSDSIFRAASLSKAMFAYLVLKLIIANQWDEATPNLGKFKLPIGLNEFNLDTPLYKIIPDLASRFPTEDAIRAQALTAQHVLSHQTGLPINERDGQTLKFKFDPGTEYGYSNPGIMLLQEVIDKLTGSNLQALAHENIFQHLNMNHSHFYGFTRVLMAKEVPENIARDTLVMILEGNQLSAHWLENGKIFTTSFSANVVQHILPMLPKVGEYSDNVNLVKAIALQYCQKPPMNAANSLHTTANDYARFMSGWLKEMDMKGNDILKKAFEKPAVMKYDRWAAEQGLTEEDRKKVTWGTGIGLQLNDHGKVIRAFHTGDMDEWRACVAVDLETKKGIVYFANSKNGNILTNHIINSNVDLKAALDFFFEKYGFAKTVGDLGEKEIRKVIKIITRHELDLNELQAKDLINVNIKPLNLTITYQPGHSLMMLAIKNEFEDFIKDFTKKNPVKSPTEISRLEESQNQNGAASLAVIIYDEKLFEKFITKLYKDNLLPKEIKAAKKIQDVSYEPPRTPR